MTAKRRTAIVTGGTRGIGLGIARALAAEGFSLCLNGVRDESKVAEALGELRRTTDVVYAAADIGTAEGRARVIEACRRAFGRLDMLVNNAGVAPAVRADLLDASEESFDAVIAVNLKGPYFLSRDAAKWMREERREDPARACAIVNIGSISAYTASVNRGEYCVAKAGLGMATKLFAARLAEDGINVYELRPGIVATDMTAGVKEKYDRLIAGGVTPIRRWGTPEDVGAAVVAIARGLLPFSTGAVIDVDGGFHLRTL
ncbi:MAG TPA: 3-ketoacyl-ACP reductase [Planctomycetes bacterium]|nr:3-ketoacyl-ACP reductase [Planctomycetota bacterium]